MDRQIIYSGQVPQTTDLLNTNKQTMIALAKLCADLFGTATMATGLACVPTTPASMSVNVNPGQIYQLANVDGAAYSAIAADTTHSILKQGILMDAQSFAITAPSTAGYSQNYLIQATYLDNDINNTVLPYYNSANPSQAFNGPGGNGTSQPTTRAGQVSLQLVAGTAAATGSQTTPAVTTGYVGLWVITVANGQSTITAGNISQAANAPVLPTDLLHAMQQSATTVANDTGTFNAYVVNYTPPITALVDGMVLWFKAKNANGSASTLNVNGTGALALVGGGHAALQGGEIVVNGKCQVVYNQAINSWVLVECTGAAVQVGAPTKGNHAVQLSQVQGGSATFAVDSGAVNAYVVNPSPAVTGLTEGMIVRFRASNANTGNSTINVGGQGVMALYGQNGLLQGGEIVANGYYSAVYDAVLGVWVLGGSYLGATQVAPASQAQHAAQLQQIGHGQCRLSVVSTTQIKLSPLNGNNVIIGGVPQKVPSAGVTISNSGLSASTLYYVYAAYNGAMSLELSTTGHGTLASGVEVKSTDASRTLVGMIRTNASSQFVDSQTQRFCLNWFNRRSLSGNQGFAANRSTTSTTPVELSSAERIEFLCWPDEAVYIASPVSLSQNTSGTISSYIYVDGISAASLTVSPPSGQVVSLTPLIDQPLTEGYHYCSVYGYAVSGFTTTWQLSSTVLSMQMRG